MPVIFGFVVDAVAVDSHRRCGALRSRREITEGQYITGLDEMWKTRAQYRAVFVHDSDII